MYSNVNKNPLVNKDPFTFWTTPCIQGANYLLLKFEVSAAVLDEFPSAHIVFRMRLSRRRNSCDVLDSRKTDAAIGSRYLLTNLIIEMNSHCKVD